MINNKVIIALQSLSVYELNRLSKFIQSPYFNKNQQIIAHFEFLSNSIKTKRLVELDKDAMWKNAFETTSYNDTKLRKLNTDLLKLVEAFLAVEGFQKNPIHQANYLLKAIADRKIDKLYNSTISTVKRLSNQQLEKPASYYYYQYQIEKNIFNLTTQYEKKLKSKSDLANLNISKISENLDIFFLTEKIKYYNSLFSWKNIAKHEEKIQFIGDLVNNIEKIDYRSFPILYGHYLIYLTNREPNKRQYFMELKEVIFRNIENFPRDEMKIIFDSACNYCVREANKGNKEFFLDLFNLYKYGITSEILLENEELDPALFRNICLIALRLKHFGWVENFISQHSQFINERFRKNAISFNLARLYWYQDKFKEVIGQLRDVEYDDIFYNLNSKVILLSTYYELDEFDALDFLVKSFKVFLRRKKNLPDKIRTNYLNFTKYLEKLSKLEYNDQIKYDKLIVELNREKEIASKSWLLRKAEELKAINH